MWIERTREWASERVEKRSTRESETENGNEWESESEIERENEWGHTVENVHFRHAIGVYL